MKTSNQKIYAVLLVLMSLLAGTAMPETQTSNPVFKPEEIEQLIAPIALYPDSLLSQILMASTYPLEVVQAKRWGEQNKSLGGEALAVELEKQSWDPSVKSLVNFPQILTMMNEKLDWTQKLGDAFLAQQKEVLDAVQRLRQRAMDEGSLKTSEQQVVKEEQDVIVIEYADPQVVYVPTYDPVVIYGSWPYPAYPPYYYYPPGYVQVNPLINFGAGVAVGLAWGYAWGHCDWHGGEIDIDINENIDINRNIDRGKYADHYQKTGRLDQSGRGSWQHNSENRKGVAYRDQATAQKFNRASTTDAVQSREAFRGRAEQGQQAITRGDADQFKGTLNTAQRGTPQTANRPGITTIGPGSGTANRGNALEGIERGAARTTPSPGIANRSATTPSTGAVNRGATTPATGLTRTPSAGASTRGSAFDGMDRGSSAKSYSSRGSSSLQSMSRSTGSRSPAVRSTGTRSGGGGRAGGGGRR